MTYRLFFHKHHVIDPMYQNKWKTIQKTIINNSIITFLILQLSTYYQPYLVKYILILNFYDLLTSFVLLSYYLNLFIYCTSTTYSSIQIRVQMLRFEFIDDKNYSVKIKDTYPSMLILFVFFFLYDVNKIKLLVN